MFIFTGWSGIAVNEFIRTINFYMLIVTISGFTPLNVGGVIV